MAVDEPTIDAVLPIFIVTRLWRRAQAAAAVVIVAAGLLVGVLDSIPAVRKSRKRCWFWAVQADGTIRKQCFQCSRAVRVDFWC